MSDRVPGFGSAPAPLDSRQVFDLIDAVFDALHGARPHLPAHDAPPIQELAQLTGRITLRRVTFTSAGTADTFAEVHLHG